MHTVTLYTLLLDNRLITQVPDLINDGWTKIMRNLQQKFMDTRKKAMRTERAERAEREGTGDTGGVDTVNTVNPVNTVKGINELMELADHEQVLLLLCTMSALLCVQCLHYGVCSLCVQLVCTACVYSLCVQLVCTACMYSLYVQLCSSHNRRRLSNHSKKDDR